MIVIQIAHASHVVHLRGFSGAQDGTIILHGQCSAEYAPEVALPDSTMGLVGRGAPPAFFGADDWDVRITLPPHEQPKLYAALSSFAQEERDSLWWQGVRFGLVLGLFAVCIGLLISELLK